MALTDSQWATIERRSGVPRRVMQILLGRGERSAQSSVSPKGAFGRAQLMPGTARNLERKYHISTQGEFGNILGGALYLGEQKRNFGSWRLAFAAYNAGPGAVQEYHGVPPYRETRDYVDRTMSALAQGGGPEQLGSARVGRHSGAPSMFPGTPGTPARYVAGVPDYRKVYRQSITDWATGEGDLDPLNLLENLSAERQRASEASRVVPGTPGTPGMVGPRRSGGTQGPTGRGDKLGKVIFAANADRPGVKTQPDIIAFARAVSHRFGAPLTVGTGTRHSQMTVNGNQSQHWTGEAVDIPASGARLTRMGQAALIAAGADPRWARKQKGGLFNVHGRQVIFNTTQGGNHWNHLHLGA